MGGKSVKRTLGIDPGSYFLGVGCIEWERNSVRLIHAEAIAGEKSKPLFERLESISARLRILVEELNPDEIAVEDIFFAKNARSAFQLGVARGVAIGACLGRGIQIFEYPPTTIKSVVTGHGRADKSQVQKMVQMIVGQKLPLRHDATDALAVALCHAFSARPLGRA